MSRYTLKVYPAGHGREIYRTIKISGKETLDRLCEYILDAFDLIEWVCFDERTLNAYQSEIVNVKCGGAHYGNVAL